MLILTCYEKEVKMGKMLRCKDISVDCAFLAQGKTEEEVLKKAAEHARKDHGIKKVTQDYFKFRSRHIRPVS